MFVTLKLNYLNFFKIMTEQQDRKSEKKHPIYDFLTDEVVQLLRDINEKKLKQPYVVLCGGGGRGKTCFMNVIKKVFKSVDVPARSIASSYCKYYTALITHTNPDIVVIPEDDGQIIELILKNDTRKEIIGEHKAYLFIVTNVFPKSVADNSMFKIIEFKNEYHHLVGTDNMHISNKPGITIKPSLWPDQVVNDEAVKIVKDCLIISK